MGINYEDLEEVCQTLGMKLQEYNDRIRKDGGNVTESDLKILDMLTHAIKSVKTTMAMMDSSSYDGGSYGRSYGNGSYNNGGGMSGRYYNRSGARGRYAARDSMGRYSGADQNEEIITQLQEIMQEAPDDQTRKEFEKLIRKLENMG